MVLRDIPSSEELSSLLLLSVLCQDLLSGEFQKSLLSLVDLLHCGLLLFLLELQINKNCQLSALCQIKLLPCVFYSKERPGRIP